MTTRIFSWLAVIASCAWMSVGSAQQPGPQAEPPPAAPEGIEVLAQGPVHEAFAATTETPAGGAPIIKKAPPEPIEELPPDEKPEGDNVQWISGYWHYDEDRSDYIWISGFWRVPPPGHVWVPGSWREVVGGYQWVHGFWQDSNWEKPQIEYLPPPPASIEVAPSTVAPGENYTYVPGCWVYRNRYVWRPGYWIDCRPGWIWTPACYRWSPAGYIYVDGYWDYPLAGRGVLFAPVYYTAPIYTRPRYYYSPTFAIATPCLYTSLFVRSGWGCYYFGNYFEARYTSRGYNPWCGTVPSSGFAISVSFGRGAVYNPLWDYYRVSYRSNPGWVNNVNVVYTGRYNGTVARPPATLIQQTTVVNNITNNTVINNTTINNRQNLTMVTSLKEAAKTNESLKLKPIAQDERVKEQVIANDVRKMGRDRKQLETQISDRGNVPVKATDPPRTVKLDVPKAVTARAQIPEAKKAAMPPPAPKLAAPVTPVPAPRVDPKVDPKTPAPKIDPKPAPKADPPKTDPPKPPAPKTDPPKTDPPKPPAPKSDPPKTDPPKPPAPKSDPPKTDPPKPPAPKNDPPKTDPPKPPVPKADPPAPKPTTPPPTPTPKTDVPKPPTPAPKTDPPKSPAPKTDPPKPAPTPAPKPMTPTPAPKADPPKPSVPPPAPTARVDPPKPAPVFVLAPKPSTPAPAPKADPPKPSASAPKSPPPKSEGEKSKDPKKPN